MTQVPLESLTPRQTAGGGSAGEELLKNAEGGSGARLARDARNMLRNIFRASRCAMLRGGSQGNPCPSGNVVEKIRICFAGTADCRAIQPWTEGIQGLSRKCHFVRIGVSGDWIGIYVFAYPHIARLSATVLGFEGFVAR